jgi:hypothetical protein
MEARELDRQIRRYQKINRGEYTAEGFNAFLRETIGSVPTYGFKADIVRFGAQLGVNAYDHFVARPKAEETAQRELLSMLPRVQNAYNTGAALWHLGNQYDGAAQVIDGLFGVDLGFSVTSSTEYMISRRKNPELEDGLSQIDSRLRELETQYQKGTITAQKRDEFILATIKDLSVRQNQDLQQIHEQLETEKAENQKRQSEDLKFQMRLEANEIWTANVVAVGTMIGADPQALRAISTATNSINLVLSTFRNYQNTAHIESSLSLATGNYVFAALQIMSVFGGGGKSEQAIMMEALRQISEQIQEFRDFVEKRFRNLDETLVANHIETMRQLHRITVSQQVQETLIKGIDQKLDDLRLQQASLFLGAEDLQYKRLLTPCLPEFYDPVFPGGRKARCTSTDVSEVVRKGTDFSQYNHSLGRNRQHNRDLPISAINSKYGYLPYLSQITERLEAVRGYSSSREVVHLPSWEQSIRDLQYIVSTRRARIPSEAKANLKQVGLNLRENLADLLSSKQDESLRRFEPESLLTVTSQIPYAGLNETLSSLIQNTTQGRINPTLGAEQIVARVANYKFDYSSLVKFCDGGTATYTRTEASREEFLKSLSLNPRLDIKRVKVEKYDPLPEEIIQRFVGLHHDAHQTDARINEEQLLGLNLPNSAYLLIEAFQHAPLKEYSRAFLETCVRANYKKISGTHRKYRAGVGDFVLRHESHAFVFDLDFTVEFRLVLTSKDTSLNDDRVILLSRRTRSWVNQQLEKRRRLKQTISRHTLAMWEDGLKGILHNPHNELQQERMTTKEIQERDETLKGFAEESLSNLRSSMKYEAVRQNSDLIRQINQDLALVEAALELGAQDLVEKTPELASILFGEKRLPTVHDLIDARINQGGLNGRDTTRMINDRVSRAKDILEGARGKPFEIKNVFVDYHLEMLK